MTPRNKRRKEYLLQAMLKRFIFREEGKSSRTVQASVTVNGTRIPVYTNAFWTSRQRQANALHEVSYRACFKPQLPRFFIERLTKAGDVVYDPFPTTARPCWRQHSAAGK